jgi:hypothetical protein
LAGEKCVKKRKAIVPIAYKINPSRTTSFGLSKPSIKVRSLILSASFVFSLLLSFVVGVSTP